MKEAKDELARRATVAKASAEERKRIDAPA
jgi:hypothetical protein